MTPFCDWPVRYLNCDPIPDGELGFPEDTPPAEGDALSEEQALDRAGIEDMAARLLWEWTGRIFGLCTVKVRPCRVGCDGIDPATYYDGPGSRYSRSGFLPVLIDGAWYNLGCGQCNKTECACPSSVVTKRVLLPGPVHSIVRVVIEGVELPASAYTLQGRALVRTDGEAWPPCQDMNAPIDSEDAWYVEYERGIEVPAGGQIAAGVLASELYKALCQDASCQLPQRVQSVTRQGVSIAILDSFEDVQDGRTGIWAIDAWIASVNAPQKRPSRVYSPDLRRR